MLETGGLRMLLMSAVTHESFPRKRRDSPWGIKVVDTARKESLPGAGAQLSVCLVSWHGSLTSFHHVRACSRQDRAFIVFGSLMNPYLAEAVGTMILILLGNGVVAGVVLQKTKSHDSGWIVITAGWGLAVAVAVYMVGAISGAHINPAVTIALALIGHGSFGWSQVPGYIMAQMIGALLGSVLVWLAYLPHWKETTDKASKLAVFSTAPAIRHPGKNLISEMIGTFVLVLGVLTIARPANLVPDSGFDKGLGPLLVGLLVFSIGLSLGGSTGYAINPARDLGPRIAHALLPIHGKGGSDWSYAWVPVLGPLLGGTIAALVFKWLW